MLAAIFILTTVFFLLAPQKDTAVTAVPEAVNFAVVNSETVNAGIACAQAASGSETAVRSISPIVAFCVGAMFALVAFVPGFSSSTFLLLLGLYEPINAAIKTKNLAILIPFALGVVIFAFPFSKCIEFLLKRVFTGFFHVIIGFVLASAVLIVSIASKGYDYMQIGSLACLVTFIGGGIFSYWMCKVSKKYGV
jgi:uncharacterized membrane protein